MNVKENQQYQQTHEKITTAVIALLESKPLRQITVSEICRAVRINRSTFYEHFLDTQDVLNQIKENITKNLDALLADADQEKEGRNRSSEDEEKMLPVADDVAETAEVKSAAADNPAETAEVKSVAADNVNEVDEAEGGQISKTGMIRLFHHVYEYRSFYRICFEEGLDLPLGYAQLLPSEEAALSEYQFAFFRAGLNALLRLWLEQDCRETPEELYQILETIQDHS